MATSPRVLVREVNFRGPDMAVLTLRDGRLVGVTGSSVVAMLQRGKYGNLHVEFAFDQNRRPTLRLVEQLPRNQTVEFAAGMPRAIELLTRVPSPNQPQLPASQEAPAPSRYANPKDTTMIERITGVVDRGNNQVLLQLVNGGSALLAGSALTQLLLSGTDKTPIYIVTDKGTVNPKLMARTGVQPLVTYREFRPDLARKIVVLSTGPNDAPSTPTPVFLIPSGGGGWWPRPRPPGPPRPPRPPSRPVPLPAPLPAQNPALATPRLENPCCTSWGCVYWENAAGYTSSDNAGGPYAVNHSVSTPSSGRTANPTVTGPTDLVNRSTAQTVFLADDPTNPDRVTMVWQKDNLGVETIYTPVNPVWGTAARADGMRELTDGDKTFIGVPGLIDRTQGVLIDGVVYAIVNNDDVPFAKFAPLGIHDGKPSGAVIMVGTDTAGIPLFSKISPLGSVLSGCCSDSSNVPSGCSELTAPGVTYRYFGDLTTPGGSEFALFYVEVATQSGDREPQTRQGLVAIPRCSDKPQIQDTLVYRPGSGDNSASGGTAPSGTTPVNAVITTITTPATPVAPVVPAAVDSGVMPGSLPRPPALAPSESTGGCCGIASGRGGRGGVGAIGARNSNPAKFARFQNPCGPGCGCKPCKEQWPDGDETMQEIRIANPAPAKFTRFQNPCGPGCGCKPCKQRWPEGEVDMAAPMANPTMTVTKVFPIVASSPKGAGTAVVTTSDGRTFALTLNAKQGTASMLREASTPLTKGIVLTQNGKLSTYTLSTKDMKGNWVALSLPVSVTLLGTGGGTSTSGMGVGGSGGAGGHTPPPVSPPAGRSYGPTANPSGTVMPFMTAKVTSTGSVSTVRATLSNGAVVDIKVPASGGKTSAAIAKSIATPLVRGLRKNPNGSVVLVMQQYPNNDWVLYPFKAVVKVTMPQAVQQQLPPGLPPSQPFVPGPDTTLHTVEFARTGDVPGQVVLGLANGVEVLVVPTTAKAQAELGATAFSSGRMFMRIALLPNGVAHGYYENASGKLREFPGMVFSYGAASTATGPTGPSKSAVPVAPKKTSTWW